MVISQRFIYSLSNVDNLQLLDCYQAEHFLKHKKGAHTNRLTNKNLQSKNMNKTLYTLLSIIINIYSSLEYHDPS